MNAARVSRQLLRAALRPAGQLYGVAAALRRAAYGVGLLRAHRLPVPVVAVGGLALGGEGKTPVAAEIARRLERRGLRVGLVTGGYCSTLGDRIERVPSAPWWEADRAAAARFGDEAVLLASWLPDAVVVAGADKARAAMRAHELGCDVVVIDDGLQHLRLERDVEILVGAGAEPLPLPAGDGRERGWFVRPDFRWVHARDGALRLAGDVASRNAPAVLITGTGVRLGSPALLRHKRVFLLSAVARPRAFVDLVVSLGARVVGQRALRDHRVLRAADLRRAARAGAELVVCTEKDAARMAGTTAVAANLTALVCAVEVAHGGPRIGALLDPLCGAAVGRRAGAPPEMARSARCSG